MDENTNMIKKETASKNSNKKCLITSWQPSQEDIVVTTDGKIFIMLFDKLLGMEKMAQYNKFYIKKSAYEKQLEVISRYMNFFMKFYDPEHEMASAFLKIKFALDREKRFNEENQQELIDLIYEVLFTDSIIEKICRMVEENYLDDIESSENSKKYVSKERKHLESLEFTNKHMKILLRISFGMKCIAPILFHYTNLNNIKVPRDGDLIYNFYKKLFTIFSDGVNIYNKLFVYVKTKVLESKSHNAPIFEQRDIMGVDEYSVLDKFLKNVLISDNMVKYKFNEHYDKKLKKYKENIVGFNKTIIKYQLVYFIKDQYTKNLTEVTSAKNVDGLSGMDKLEMNMQKIDEGLTIMAELNIKNELRRIERDNDFGITDEEIDYYIKYHKPSKLQAQLVYSYWCKNFGSYRNTKLVKRRDYIKILLILKRKLLLEAGNEHDEFSETAILPYLLTGNVQDKVNTRIIRNSKFSNKVSSSYLYQRIITNQYGNLYKIKPDYIQQILSEFINTPFTYVVYENQDLLDKEIVVNDDKICDEILFFLNNIL